MITNIIKPHFSEEVIKQMLARFDALSPEDKDEHIGGVPIFWTKKLLDDNANYAIAQDQMLKEIKQAYRQIDCLEKIVDFLLQDRNT